MVDVLTEIIINKRLDVVADYATDPDHAPEWYVNIKSVEWKTPKPLMLGSKIAFTAKFLGRQLFYIYQITEFFPRRKLVMQTAEGPFPMETTYIWTKVDENKTRMSLRNKGNPAGFSKLFSPLMSIMMRDANNKDLKRLKEVLEKGN
ncbi:MAG TPA: SRPBCC family protein [Chitinophagaceae bacterium]|jgi:hypothetical protein|nr:SRPBCC family protein [Chitinophagaceae bacterium]